MDTEKQDSTKSTPDDIPLLEPSLLRVLLIAAAAYYVIWAIIASLLGKGFATWIATPLWGLPIFIIAKWDRIRAGQGASWRELLNVRKVFKIPKLSYWKITLASLTIQLLITVVGIAYGIYIATLRPKFFETLPDDYVGVLDKLTDDWHSIAILWGGISLSYFAGGYVAGVFASKRYLAPYTHAALAATLAALFNLLLTISLLVGQEEQSAPTEEDMGFLILAFVPYLLFSLLGARLAVRKNQLNRMAPVQLSNTKEVSENAEEASVLEPPNQQDVVISVQPEKITPLKGKSKTKSRKKWRRRSKHK